MIYGYDSAYHSSTHLYVFCFSEYNCVNGESSNNWNIPSYSSHSSNYRNSNSRENSSKKNINNINLSPKVRYSLVLF